MPSNFNLPVGRFPDFHEVRLEVTNHCGYNCFCCPREKMTRSCGRMSLENIQRVVAEIKCIDHPFKLHLVGYGEPLLLSDLPQLARVVKEQVPHASVYTITTLGVKRSREYFEDLLRWFDEVEVSFYGSTREQYLTIHGVDRYDLALHNLEMIQAAARTLDSSAAINIKLNDFTQMPRPTTDAERAAATLLSTQFKKMGFTISSTELHNYGDGRSYTCRNSFEPCSVAWGMRSHILQITWDMKVVPCCFMFNADVVWGDLNKKSLQEIFSSPNRADFLRNLLLGNADLYPACKNCSDNSGGSPGEKSRLIRYLQSREIHMANAHQLQIDPQALFIETYLQMRMADVTGQYAGILIWGTGKHTEFLMDVMSPDQLNQVVGIVDEGTEADRFYQWTRIAPDKIHTIEADAVVISSDLHQCALKGQAETYTSLPVITLYLGLSIEPLLEEKYNRLRAVSRTKWHSWIKTNACERMDAIRAWDIFEESRWRFHLARYRFACSYTEGKRVGDIACGTGYGSEILFKRGAAKSVVGVDLAEDAVTYARKFHADGYIEYIASSGDATGLKDEAFDLLTSFETLEHLPDGKALLAEFYRLLKPDGTLIISTPNDWPLDDNPHHCAEYDFDGFIQALEPWFEVLEVYNQNSGGGSPNNHDQPAGIVETTLRNRDLAECFIAVCKKKS